MKIEDEAIPLLLKRWSKEKQSDFGRQSDFGFIENVYYRKSFKKFLLYLSNSKSTFV